MDRIYTPEGSFAYLLVVLVATLLAAVGYLLAFTNASLPLASVGAPP